jgi:hypothetical protein
VNEASNATIEAEIFKPGNSYTVFGRGVAISVQFRDTRIRVGNNRPLVM